MSKSIKVNPPYKPLVQMPYCCAACTIQWVLFRRGYWLDQEVIAKELRIKIPKGFQKFFSVKLPLCEKVKDAGPILGPLKDVGIINNMFMKYKIPLVARAYPISKIKYPARFIVENLRAKKDLVVMFHWKGMGKRWDWSHRAVIVEFEMENKIVTLGDPGYDLPKYWKIPLSKLIRAMNKKYDNYIRGFLTIESK